MVDIKELERIGDQALAAIGYDLVDLEFTRDQQGWLLRVYIDHPHEGQADKSAPPSKRITHEDCTRASRHLGTVLDVEDPIEAAYRLELSSPGLLRPLSKMRDFKRFVGFAVRMKLSEPVEDRRSLVGVLTGAAESDNGAELSINVDGRVCTVPWDRVLKARLDEEY